MKKNIKKKVQKFKRFLSFNNAILNSKERNGDENFRMGLK
jgi:hypothetical protein